MKPGNPVIQDGEYLRYSMYAAGEKVFDYYLVTRVLQDKKSVYLYEDSLEIGMDMKLSANYSNFHNQYKINLEDGSLIYHKTDYMDFTNIALSNRYKGSFGTDLVINKSNAEAEYMAKIWDGFGIKSMTSRIKIKPDYPIWDFDSIGYIGLRLFEPTNKGIIYIIAPDLLKEPIPVSFSIKGREVVKTKAGVFNTVKLGMFLADPFLGKLLEGYVREVFAWVEDSDRGLVIKTKDIGNTYIILEEIGLWK
jgi:hypothetical protein